MARVIIQRFQRQAKYFIEDLGNDVGLDMVLIPGGSFLMGSPETEEGHQEAESPQHYVTIRPFCMGKYPITQAQWKVVAALPQVNRELDPDPSRFKGASHPVERVSWYDAVEFCVRLTNKTGREYRLPSEAEWEYACRAGTTTPFHFGETITTDLANYRGTDHQNYGWSGAYGRGSQGIYRQETTPVGSSKVANAFGLFDMHGNVREWCADHWHSNYQGAPDDGSAWIEPEPNKNKPEPNKNNNESQFRVLRGGSWRSNPVDCRSAYRFSNSANYIHNFYSFRVVCAAGWTL